MAIERLPARFRIKCDRCTNNTGFLEVDRSLDDQELPKDWGRQRFQYTIFQNENAVGREDKENFLCPSCVEELKVFLAAKSNRG